MCVCVWGGGFYPVNADLALKCDRGGVNSFDVDTSSTENRPSI